jgi:hypothetical protein
MTMEYDPIPSDDKKMPTWMKVAGVLGAGAVVVAACDYAADGKVIGLFGPGKTAAYAGAQTPAKGDFPQFVLENNAAMRVVENYIRLRKFNNIRVKCIKQDVLNILTYADADDGKLDGHVSLAAVQKFVQEDLEHLAKDYKGRYPHVENIPANMDIDGEGINMVVADPKAPKPVK